MIAFCLECMVFNPQYSLWCAKNCSCCFWVYCCGPWM